MKVNLYIFMVYTVKGLIVFSGTASILFLDGPVTQVCAGRIDHNNGTGRNH